MEFLGIGPLELVLILLIALIVLGPKDMTRLGRTLGRWLFKLTTSPTYRKIVNLPSTLMREAGLEELDAVMDKGKRNQNSIWSGETPKRSAGAVSNNQIPSEWISPPVVNSESHTEPSQLDATDGEETTPTNPAKEQ